jgi:hemolysin activation/secretion protein
MSSRWWSASLLALLALPAVSQTAPSAGSLLQELRPPAVGVPRADPNVLPQVPAVRAPLMPATGLRVTPRRLRITGTTRFSEAQLLPLVADAIGRELDVGELEALAARISRHYRRNGYTVARAYLPQQDTSDGTIEIAVIEGRFGAVTVQGPTDATRGLPLGALAVGDVVADTALERSLLLAADAPGISLRSTLQPGASVGTSELVIDVQDDRRWAASLDVDSFGSSSTGRYRAGGSMFIYRPLGIGDLVTLRGLSSGSGLGYLRAAYQVPVGQNGLKAGLALSEMRYRLGEQFELLDARGSARIATLFAAYPLLRSRSSNLNLQASLDHKRIQDRIDAAAIVTDKTVAVFSLGVSGDRRDDFGGGGVTVLSATYSRGRVAIESPEARAVDASSARTDGAYGKWTATALRVQALGTSTSLQVSYSGQWTSGNLDSSEKMALGGATAVRAYPQGEAPSDRASLLTVELRQGIGAGWQALAFVDAARGTLNARPWTPDTGQRRRLVGAGVGLSWAAAPGWSASLSYARKLDHDPADTTGDRSGRLWAQASKAF